MVDATAIDVFAHEHAAGFRAKFGQRCPDRVAPFDRADHVVRKNRVFKDRGRNVAAERFPPGLTEATEVQGNLPACDPKNPCPQLAPSGVECTDSGQRGEPGILVNLFGGRPVAMQQVGNKRKNIVGMVVIRPCPGLRLAPLQLVHNAVGVVGHRWLRGRMDRVSYSIFAPSGQILRAANPKAAADGVGRQVRRKRESPRKTTKARPRGR